MYKLEDRILFDGAAAADVTDAQQEAEAQQEAAEQAANDSSAQNNDSDSSNSDNSTSDATDSSSADQTTDADSLAEALAAIHTNGLGSDGQRVDVLLVSSSLENADDVCNAADANTIVVKYDADTTSAADLLQLITDALDGKVADSIGFVTESGENAHVQLFSDTDTSLDTVNGSANQNFFHGLDALLDEGGQVNLFASNLASTAEGKTLVDAISDTLEHNVAASTDETGGAESGGDWTLEYSADGSVIDAGDIYLDADMADNFTSLLEDHVNNEVVFINYTVKDVDKIIAELGSDVDIVMLSSDNAIEEMNAYLSEHTDIDTVRIFTHGNAGYIKLGSTDVDSEYLQEHPEVFADWDASLSANADILIYGCNLAETQEGQAFVNTIASLTGADVAASIDDTGLDGNWALEFSVGVIETKDIYVADYQYNLAEITLLVESIEDNPILVPTLKPYTLREAVYIANKDLANTYRINFANQTKLGGNIISLVAGEMVINNDITINARSHIEGNTYTRIIIDAGKSSRHFVINENTNVIFDSFVLRNGFEENGGSIYNAGSLQLNACSLYSNEATNAGGAVYNTGDLLITANMAVAGSVWTSDFYEFYSNKARTAGGAVYNAPEGNLTILGQSPEFTVDFGSYYIDEHHNLHTFGNSVTSGSGGAIYSLGTASFELGVFQYNTASADGGAVYVTSASGLTHFDTVDFHYNSAKGDGGGLYFTQGDDVMLEWCWFTGNTADGDGGGIYFSSSGTLEVVTSSSTGIGKNTESYFDNNSAGQNGGAIYMNYSGSLVVDFVEFNGNDAGTSAAGGNGGAIYVVNSGNVTLTDVNIESGSANSGTVYGGLGGGLYVDSANTIIKTSNISGNTAVDGGGIYQLAGSLKLTNDTLAYNAVTGDGGAVWFGEGALAVTYATIAYNTATGDGSAIYFADASLINPSTFSIKDTLVYNTSAPNSQIALGAGVKVSNSSYNIFSHYNTNTGAALSDEIYTSIERYYPGSSVPTEIGQVDGRGNIVGHDTVSINEIQTYTYLDTQLRYHANYRTRALAILYTDSLAYKRGSAVSGVTHDQRGNVRGSAPTIGAFEPLFYVTVTSNGDDSSLVYSNDVNAQYFDEALKDGLTLREAAYWLDTYNPDSLPTNVVVDTNRYVKFDLPDGYQINISYGAIRIGGYYFGNDAYKNIRISITPDDIWSSDDTYVAQNADNRIVVDANNTSGIFDIFGGSVFYLSNLTLQNGTVHRNPGNFDYGRGGGIYNLGTTYLNNVVVQDCTASNDLAAPYYSNMGWGGGVYNGGTMYIYDSTITGNKTNAFADNDHPVTNVSKGGGIYNDGHMEIERSTIDNNSTAGNVQYNTNAAQGGGIYNAGTLTITNSTIAYNTTNATNASNAVAGAGAAIFIASGNVTMNYCTVIYNSTLLNSGDTPDEFRAAIVADGGYFTLRDSIVGQNTVRVSSDTEPKVTPADIYINDTYVTVTDGGYNIIGYFNYDSGAGTGYNWANGTNTITGDTANNDVLYYISSTLEYNGGKTKNFRLLSGSYALDNGVAVSGITTGQRGAERPALHTSIGAYQILEYVYITSNADSGSTPALTGFDFAANRAGFVADTITLRDAFYWADPGTRIVVRYLDGSTNWGTSETNPGNKIKLTNGEIYVIKSLTVDGTVYYYNYVESTNGQKVVIDFSKTNHYFYVIGQDDGKAVYYDNSWGKYYYMSSGAKVYLNQVAVSAGDVTKEEVKDAEGNVKYSYYKENSTDTKIIADSSGNYFYLVDVDGNRVSVDTVAAVGSTFSYYAKTNATGTDLDVSAQDKSRIFNINNNDESWILSVGISDMTLRNGYTATGNGGAIYSLENLSTTRVNVLDSEAKDGFGGGVYVQIGDFYSISSNFNDNVAGKHGGGVYTNGGNVYIENSSFESNTAALNGGGLTIIATRDHAEIISSTFYNNTAGEHGGGVSIDSSYTLIINSTVSNNTAGYNGGGIYFTGGADLELGYVTIANNTAGAEGDVARNSGGGIFQAAGTFILTNSIVAQNWSLDASEVASHSDYFAGVSVTILNTGLFNIGGGRLEIGSSIMGEANRDFSGYGGMIVLGTLGNTGQSWNDLRIDTDATDNGGIYDNITKTVYVFSGSLALNNADASKIPTVAGLTDVDQRGVSRTLNPGEVTIGAYQKNLTTYYLKDGADPTLVSSWNTQIGGGGTDATSFSTPDQTFIFDNDTTTISSDWDVSYKNTVQVGYGANISDVTMSGTDIAVNLNLVILAGSAFTVAGGVFQSAPSTSGYSVISNSGTFTVTGGTVTGNIILGAGSTLAIGVEDKAWKDFTISSIDLSSTVIYNYDGKQTVRTIAYGNLTISGSGAKTAKGTITVAGDFNNSSEFKSSYDLTVDGDTVSTGSIKAKNITLNGTANDIDGDVTASRNLVFGGGVSTGLLKGKDVEIVTNSTVHDISATTISGGADITVTGTVTAKDMVVGILTLNNGASVTTVNVTLDAVYSLSGNNTLKFTGTDANSNFSAWTTINVSGGSTLNIDRGRNDIYISDGSVTPSFDINNMTVSSTSTLKFITTKNIFVTDVSGTLPNFNGTLWLKSKDITISETCNFEDTNLSLVLDNSGYFNLEAGATFKIKNGIGINNLRIIEGGIGDTTATIESTTGYITIINSITSTNSAYNLVLNAATTVSVNKVSGINDLTLNAGTSVTVGGGVKIGGDFTADAGTTVDIKNKVTAGGDVSITSVGGLNLAGDIAATNDITVNGLTVVDSDVSVTGATLDLGGEVTGAGTLALGITGAANFGGGVDMTGGLVLNKGTFITGADITASSLNIKSPASLTLDATESLTAGNLINAGTLNASTVKLSGDMTNTGTMTISELHLYDSGTAYESQLSLGGTVDITSITVAADKNAALTKGNISVDSFEFESGDTSTSVFGLGAKTSLEVANFTAVSDTYYGGSYFDTSGGGTLIQTVVGGGGSATYRVGDGNGHMAVITLTGTAAASEKIGIGILDSVKINGQVVDGIAQTDGFTLVINRDSTDVVNVAMNWDSRWNGTNFNPGAPTTTDLFVLNGNKWTSVQTVDVDSSTARSTTNFDLSHNSSYTIANSNANLTIPPLPMNVNIYEMANAHFLPMYLDFDTNIFLHFEMGYYPYFTVDTWFSPYNLKSVGLAAYRQMEYRLITSPQTNMLGGQVPPPGALLGQVLTEQASLTLTSDAPVYLEVNGEYSVGKGWVPLTEPASVENIERYQEPVTQGQIDQFYLDFGDREDIFERPVPFKSDLDEMLDNLLAG